MQSIGIHTIQNEFRKKNWPGKQASLHPNLTPETPRPRLPLTMRPFFKGQNNQKLCLSFCHSLVSQLTSFFCTIFCVCYQVIYQVFHFPNIHSVANPCNISLGHFLASFRVFLVITVLFAGWGDSFTRTV